jgi:putative spermidine/putrescine transport system permease protein
MSTAKIKKYWPLLPALAFLIFFFLIPLSTLVRYSLNRHEMMGVMKPALTLENYVKFFIHPVYLKILVNTLYMGIVVTFADFVLGYPIAYVFVRSKGLTKTLLMVLIVSPLLISAVVRSLGWVLILGDTGPLNNFLLRLGLVSEPVRLMGTLSGVIIALIHVHLPFMVLSLASALQNIDPFLERAARNLGASKAQAFFLVTLPLSKPGILAGTLLVFTITIGTYATPFLVGGMGLKILSLSVYEYFSTIINWPFGSTMAFILLVISFAMIALFNKMISSAREKIVT